MATRIIEWEGKDGELEIMKWVYNYNKHEVYRYFKNAEGQITKDKIGSL